MNPIFVFDREDIIMKKFFTREKGQGLVEYALILVLVATVVIAVLLILGPQIGSIFSRVNTVLEPPGARVCASVLCPTPGLKRAPW